MSFILDALRKSDAERQRAAAPGLADVRYAARRSRRNIWLPILVAVLAANMVFMGVQWFNRVGVGRPGELATPDTTAAGQPAVAPAAVVEPGPANDIRPLAREAEFGEPQLEPSVDRAPGAPPVAEKEAVAQPASSAPESAPAPAPALVTPPTPPTPPAPSRIIADDSLPTVEQVIGSGTVKIPMLNLDLHVYGEKAANRFVIINTHKYKEGGQLTEGPTVESITRDGVILTFQGQRFSLSRH